LIPHPLAAFRPPPLTKPARRRPSGDRLPAIRPRRRVADNAFTDPEAVRTLDLLSRQAARLDRSMRDARAHLLELQAIAAETTETQFEEEMDLIDEPEQLDEPEPARETAAAAPVAFPLRL
jgi:hypothetical protein